MKYIQRIEDSAMWKHQFEDNAKGKGEMNGSYYVVKQGGSGEKVEYIPPVAQDIIMAKARIRKYKKRGKNTNKQTKSKRRGSRKVRKKAPKRKKKSQGRKKKKAVKVIRKKSPKRRR